MAEKKITLEQLKAFIELGLTFNSTEEDVKKAYAEKLKYCNPETAPEEWMQIYNAYKNAMSYLNDTPENFAFFSQSKPIEVSSKKESFEYENIFEEIVSRNKTLQVKINDKDFEAKYILLNDGNIAFGGFEADVKEKLSKEKWSFQIPNSIEGLTVTEIEDEAFSNCKGLTEVIIPDGVRKIGRAAFCNCLDIENVKLPDTLIEIEAEAFKDCDIQTLSLPNGLKEICAGAFSNCIFLQDIKIPESVERIGEKAFEGCIMLTIAVQSRSYAHKYCKENQISVKILC